MDHIPRNVSASSSFEHGLPYFIRILWLYICVYYGNCKFCRLNLPFNRAEDAIDKVIAVNPDLKSKTVKDCNTLRIDLVGLKGIFFQFMI